MEDTGGILQISLTDSELNQAELTGEEELFPGAYFKLSVTDSGPGIETNVLNLIFEPYFTTKELRKGTGMGLAVVHGFKKIRFVDRILDTLGNQSLQFFAKMSSLPFTGS